MPLTPYQKQILAVGPELGLYLPLDGLYGAGDLSAPPQRNAGALGGLTVGGLSPGPIGRDGRTATTFDGVDDQLTTAWLARTNMVPNPSYPLNITGWSLSSGGWVEATKEREPSPAALAALSPFAARVKATHEATTTTRFLIFETLGGLSAIPVTAGLSYAYSTWVYAVDPPAGFNGKNILIEIQWYNAAGTSLSLSATQNTLNAGEVKRLSVIATAPAEAAFGKVRVVGQSNVSGDTVDIWVANSLLEQSAEVGSYFPTTLQLSTEEAGWTGTEGNSASQIGPFANGTIRTFTGWVNPSGAVTRGLWGCGSGTGDGFWITAGNLPRWRASGVDETWNSSALASGQWNFLLHVLDTRNDLSTLYLNGVSQGTKENPNPYSAALSADLRIGQTLGAFYSGGMAHFALMYGDQGPMALPLWRAGSGL